MYPYTGIIHVPEGVSGPIAVKHRVRKAGTVLPQTNGRTQFIGGHRAPSLRFDCDTAWHILEEEGRGVWMTDDPIEQWQIDRELKGMRGSVLVGGLGLGYAAKVLSRRRGVTNITVVERNPDVIRLVAPYTAHSITNLDADAHKITVVEADLFDYLRATPRRFTHAFFDIWQSDGLSTYFETVRPLLALAKGLVRHRPVCWNESVMRGQLRMQLLGQLHLKSETGFMVEDLQAVTDWPWGWFGQFWRDIGNEATEESIDRWLDTFMNQPFVEGTQ